VILLDSNGWIDLIQNDLQWMAWSKEQVLLAKAQKKIVINPVIYAELVPNYDWFEELAHFVKLSSAAMRPLSDKCAYEAGRALVAYRQRGGAKTGVLADFFIGAQAVVEGWTLLTRDEGRYKTYCPKIKLISP
jgi:predicted nucleic acid-binding protein